MTSQSVLEEIVWKDAEVTKIKFHSFQPLYLRCNHNLSYSTLEKFTPRRKKGL